MIMHNINNTYCINNNLEICVYEDEDGRRVFFIINTHTGEREEISEHSACAICTIDESTITPDNWEDFCTASGIFTEDN
jgi:hypothetical protein